MRFARFDADVRAGDPGLPELGGLETDLRFAFRHDGHDSPVVPSGGTRATVTLTHYLASPDADGVTRTNEDVTQLEFGRRTFWKWRTRNRIFVVLSGGTSFDDKPITQFQLGYPFRLDAFNVGERRGDHYGVATVGFLRRLGRLPDFMGGPIFIGSWLENGSAFNSDEDADFNTQAAVGVVVDSLIGPMVGRQQRRSRRRLARVHRHRTGVQIEPMSLAIASTSSGTGRLPSSLRASSGGSTASSWLSRIAGPAKCPSRPVSRASSSARGTSRNTNRTPSIPRDRASR